MVNILQELNCDTSTTSVCNNDTQSVIRHEPRYNKVEYNILNNSILNNNTSIGYTKDRNGYTSDDPRLFTSYRNQKLCLDRIPLESNINIKNIYNDPQLNNYGKQYKTYSDIHGGHIVYYYDKSSQDPYRYPNYTQQMKTHNVIEHDPMGSAKSYYKHYIDYNKPINTKNRQYDGQLSWIHDTQLHRQDMMAYQSRQMNKHSWEYQNRT